MALAVPGSAASPDELPLVVGNITIDAARHRVTVDGLAVELTAREFYLAWLLAQRAGQVLSYNTISASLFGLTGTNETRHLTVLVHRLRAKLGRTSPYAIETVRGRGYGLLETPASSRDAEAVVSIRP